MLICALLAALMLLSGCTLHPKVDSVNHKLSHNIIELSSPRVTVTHIHSGWVTGETWLRQEDDSMIYKGQSILGSGKTEISIKNRELTVNGKSYGALSDGDKVVYESSKDAVSINSKQVPEVASNK